MSSPRYRMPAEWEPHSATWIAWPHNEEDWPGKFECIPWAYCEIVAALSRSERVEILCPNEAVRDDAGDRLSKYSIPSAMYRLHVLDNDRSWLRDSAPIGVRDGSGNLCWTGWRFNGWAKYSNFTKDAAVPGFVSNVSSIPLVTPTFPGTTDSPVVLEGGGIEVDGLGTLLVTREWLLSDTQIRNPGFSQKDYEALFHEYLGIEKTIWLNHGIVGDDTHGHIDDLARFVAPGRVVIADENNERDPNFTLLKENISILRSATDSRGRKLDVIPLPMPRLIEFDGQRLPASYANFYIANSAVLVPLFNDPNDRIALNVLADAFPDREVVGIFCGDLVLGLGTLHCLTQQQPR